MPESEWALGVKLVLVLTATLLLAVTFYYGVIFKGQLPDHPMLRGKNDLFLHFCAFLAVAIPVRLLWTRWYSLAALVFCAAAIEGIQIFQPQRNAAFDDLAASLVGILVGAIFVLFLQRCIQKFSKRQHD